MNFFLDFSLFNSSKSSCKCGFVVSKSVVGSVNHDHGLRTPREEIAFTARPKIHSHSQIFRYGRSIFCLPHRPNFSDIFDLCLHWVSVVRESWDISFTFQAYTLPNTLNCICVSLLNFLFEVKSSFSTAQNDPLCPDT